MRKITYAAGALSLAASLAFAAPAQAGTWHHDDDPALLSVLHGVPGLTVDVWVNGQLTLDDFTPGTLAGPLELAAGDYRIAVTAADATSAENPATTPLMLRPKRAWRDRLAPWQNRSEIAPATLARLHARRKSAIACRDWRTRYAIYFSAHVPAS